MVTARKTTLALCLCVAVSGPAWAQSIARTSPDHISVHAKNVPIGRLLSEVSVFGAIDTLYIEAAIASHPVTVAIDDLSPADVVLEILQQSGLSFAVSGGRVYVGNPSAAVPLRQSLGPAGAAREQKPLAGQTPLAGPGTRVAPQHDPSEAAPSGEPPAEPAVDVTALTAAATVDHPDYTMTLENTTYKDPNFVPYKLTEAARKARMSVDVNTIP